MLNCIIIDDDLIIRKLVEEFVRKTKRLNLLGSFENPVIALSELAENEKVDVVFLDVEMPEMTGLELLDNMRTNPKVIIISGKEKYAINAFEYDVTDYLLKPITYARFYKAVMRAIEDVQDGDKNPKQNSNVPDQDLPKQKDEIFIRENSNLVRIKFSEILFVEAQENYVSLQSSEKRFLIHFTMKAIENELPIESFIRVHRSYFVNLNHIQQISGNRISMKVNKEMVHIPIGKSYKDELFNRLNLMN
ncbi:MAG: LytTR family DNA-binding domain-containing protein [Bacteroidales bacterium]|jgi:DNA-binding LytR/AlgR family response regulator|nr:LytTR family DNA-binding domain-containing protein [Bacteroidales bacterium]